MITTIPRDTFRQAIEDGIIADAECGAPALTDGDRRALRDLGHNAKQIGRSFLTKGCGCPLVESGITPTTTTDDGFLMVEVHTSPFAPFWSAYDASLGRNVALMSKRAPVCQIVEG